MRGLDSLYQQIILDAARARKGEGELAEFDAEHFEKNPSCGDELRLRVLVREGRIAEIGWVGDGCSISMASVSMMVEQLRGESVEDALAAVTAMREMLRSRGREVDPDSREAELLGDAVSLSGVGKFVMRVKCAMLGWVALEAALQQASA